MEERADPRAVFEMIIYNKREIKMGQVSKLSKGESDDTTHR